MRISILFSALASYTTAFFRCLARDHGWKVQLIYQPIRPTEAPYAHFDLTFCHEAIEDNSSTRGTLRQRVRAFEPQLVLMSSWSFAHYRRIARELRRRGVAVIATMDNQWRGTARQWLGVFTSSVFLKPAIDNFLVAGDRQAQFARRLGYESPMYGFLAGDTDAFTPPPNGRARKGFLYVGRLVQEKGVDILVRAYKLYQSRASDPWPLTVAGTGPLLDVVKGIPGVSALGFIQPGDLPELMRGAGTFVLPSRFEPWGVAIHEAAATGLPIICTAQCGASTYFVRDGLNGYVIPLDAEILAQRMVQISGLSDERISEMRSYSVKLASLWTPQLLARYFVEMTCATLRGKTGVAV